MPLPEFVVEGIVSLDRELVRYPHEHPDVLVAVVPVKLLRDMRSLIVWSADELAQAVEDRNTAVKLGVKLATRIADLEDELAEYEAHELRDEQTADYYRECV